MSGLFIVSTFLYFLGMVKYLLHLALRNKTMFILATVMIAAGFLMETAALVQRSMETGHGPYTNTFEYCVFLAWAIFGVFLVAEGYFKIKPLGAFMVPVGFLMMLVAFPLSPDTDPTLPAKAYWLTMHRTMSFMSFAAFTMVFAAGVMYLIQEKQLKSKNLGGWYYRLPSLDSLDDMNRKGLVFGFPIITVGVLAALVWSTQHYGTVIKLNPSNTMLLLGWVIYAMAGFGRLAFGWRGKKTATLGIAGFLIVSSVLMAHIN